MNNDADDLCSRPAILPKKEHGKIILLVAKEVDNILIVGTGTCLDHFTTKM